MPFTVQSRSFAAEAEEKKYVAPVAISKLGKDYLFRPRPLTPGQRHVVQVKRANLWKGRPVKNLTFGLLRKAGRGHGGRICVRRRGGGHKRLYRIIDFKRSIHDADGVVQRLEYDPNRSATIALVAYPSGQLTYIIAPEGIRSGDTVCASRTKELDIKLGNAMPLAHMPIGTIVHNLEMRPGQGAQLCRSAGTSAQLLEKNMRPGYALVRLASKEHRLVHMSCMATIGQVSNPLHKHRKLGKAGRSRWLGIRPHVRGTAMNPVDHPHGGGEGRKAPGRPSCSPTGVLAKGFKTRNKKKGSSKLILVPRGGVAKNERG